MQYFIEIFLNNTSTYILILDFINHVLTTVTPRQSSKNKINEFNDTDQMQLETYIEDKNETCSEGCGLEHRAEDQQEMPYANETEENIANEQDVENSDNQEYSFLNYFITVQNMLIKNVHKSLKSKIALLKSIKDNLLFEISTNKIQLGNVSNFNLI